MTMRPLLTVLFCATLLAASPVSAGGGGGAAKGKEGGAYVDLAQMGLPIIVNGKIKNYVFVQMRLKPGGGADVIKLREKEPFYRDALIRAAHRASFGRADDWTVVDEARLEAVLLAEARRIAGPKAFAGAELLRQTPRKRTGMLQAKHAPH
ncbi:MAG: hypothetical protein M3M95_00115 [Pseudomonadota bacterium]|nr:hypothetical protein [Pseudomonadota bacterium]